MTLTHATGADTETLDGLKDRVTTAIQAFVNTLPIVPPQKQ